LWKSDGSAEGTQLVADVAPGVASAIPPSYSSRLGLLQVIGGAVYFAADDGVHGVELWKSDGTAAGTTLLREFTPGAAGSALLGLSLVPVGPRGTFAFVAPDAAGGQGLWRSDGTTEGTWPLSGLEPGSAPSQLTVSGSRLFFVADESAHGQELWSVKHAAFQQRP
jgi:ELWxxDGT repeat protein